MNLRLDLNDIDAEHHVQLGLTQALCAAASYGADETRTQEILDQLVVYSDMHFLSEQLLMRLSGYPDYDSHALQHDDLMEQLETVNQQYSSAGEPFTLLKAKAILEFLVNHIGAHDRRFIDYYRDWVRRSAADG